VLVQRAVSEDPRWTRAVGDHLVRLQERNEGAWFARCAQYRAASATHFLIIVNLKALARATGTSWRASGWTGEKVDLFEHPIWYSARAVSIHRSASRIDRVQDGT